MIWALFADACLPFSGKRFGKEATARISASSRLYWSSTLRFLATGRRGPILEGQENASGDEKPQNEASEASKVVTDGDLSAVVDDTSEVQQHAVDEAAKKEAEAQAKAANEQAAQKPVETPQRGEAIKGKTTQDGELFDPRYHESNPDGTPRLATSGYVRKKRGRRAGPGSPGQSTIRVPGSATASAGASNKSRRHRRMTAMALAGGVFAGGRLIAGKQAAPIVIRDESGVVFSEADSIVENFDDWLLSLGVSDLPPALALVVGVGMYFGRCATSANGRQSVAYAYAKMKGKEAEPPEWYVIEEMERIQAQQEAEEKAKKAAEAQKPAQ